MPFLNPVEQAYLSGTREFTKPQIRYIKCRLKKKLQRLDEQGCNVAARLQRLDALVAQPGRAKAITTNNNDVENESPRWASIPRPKVSAPIAGLRNLRSARLSY